MTLTNELIEEGIARELVNRIQNLRKDKNFDVTDKIKVLIESNEKINLAVKNNINYICSEILARSFDIVNCVEINANNSTLIELDENLKMLYKY